MYDVRIGWGEGGPQKADEMNKISGFLTLGEVKKFENFADVTYGSPLTLSLLSCQS